LELEYVCTNEWLDVTMEKLECKLDIRFNQQLLVMNMQKRSVPEKT